MSHLEFQRALATRRTALLAARCHVLEERAYERFLHGLDDDGEWLTVDGARAHIDAEVRALCDDSIHKRREISLAAAERIVEFSSE
jgi:hypothetical protein